MKKTHWVVVLAVIVGLVGYGVAAFAADAPAQPPAAKPATKPAAQAPAVAKPAAANKAAKPEEQVPCTVTGKIESKTIKNKKGADVEMCRVMVSSAKGADGKPLDALKGKLLRVVGPKLADVQKLAGKEAELTGTAVNGKRIKVDAVKEAAAGAPAAKPAPKPAAAPAAK